MQLNPTRRRGGVNWMVVENLWLNVTGYVGGGRDSPWGGRRMVPWNI